MSHEAVWSNAEFKNKISLYLFIISSVFLSSHFHHKQGEWGEKEKVHNKHDANTHKRLPEVSFSMGKCILTNPEKSELGHLTSTRKNVSFFKKLMLTEV